MEEQTSSRKGLIFIVVIIIALIIWGLLKYHNLTNAKKEIQSSTETISTEVQKQFAGAPTFFKKIQSVTSKGAGDMKAFAEAKKEYENAKTLGEKLIAVGKMQIALSDLTTLSKQYSSLETSPSFQETASGIEESSSQIEEAETSYANAVSSYNTISSNFPGNWIAKIFGLNAGKYVDSAKDYLKVPGFGGDK